MFGNKIGVNAHSAEGLASPTGRFPDTLIAGGAVFTGELVSDGDVYSDGAIRGDVKAKRLTVGESGVVEGMLEAQTVIVRGRVRGAIRAETVQLCKTADVEGEISYCALSVEAGARLVGNSIFKALPSDRPALAICPPEAKVAAE